MVRQRKTKRLGRIVLVMPNVIHSSLIPNSQDSIHISQCNVIKGKGQGEQRKF